MPGFGFDVELSVFVKMIYTRSGGLCAAENKISFDIRLRFILTDPDGLAVSDASGFLLYKFSIFQPYMDRPFLSFVLLRCLDCGVSRCGDIEHLDPLFHQLCYEYHTRGNRGYRCLISPQRETPQSKRRSRTKESKGSVHVRLKNRVLV